MESPLGSLLDNDNWFRLVFMAGVTILVLAFSGACFGVPTLLLAIAGRLYVKQLSAAVPPPNERANHATASHIFIYPVKSLRATSLEKVTIADNGLMDDRRFMLVAPRPTPLMGFFRPGEATHQFITQRQVPTLATIRAELSSHDKVATLTMSSHLLPGKRVTIHPKNPLDASGDTGLLTARIWEDSIPVRDMGEEAAAFIADIVAQDEDAPPAVATGIRLVQMENDVRRANPKYTPPSALSWTGALPKVGLTDGFPILIANQASLEELNRRLQVNGKPPIPMSRFRPNIVVTGVPAFEEDNWKIISIGGVVFHLVKGCPRCKQSCTDQESGQVFGEPLETLAEFRALGPMKGTVYFGQNAIPHTVGGTISVGDSIRILKRGDPVWDS